MYVLHLSFCGANYHGWQIQSDVPTVQGTLHEALKRILDAPDLPPPSGCGRTDEGVHAVEFIAAVRAVREMPPDNLRLGLNSLLPPDIRIMAVERVAGYRNARTLVVGKHYRYLLCRTDTLSPFVNHLVWRCGRPLNTAAMRASLRHLLGTHDFKSFQASNTDVEETERTIHQAAVMEAGPLLAIDLVGDGFLKHMVRIIAGTLVEIGRGERTPEAMSDIVAARNRSSAGVTLPGKGLYLCKLFRREEDLRNYAIPLLSTDIIWRCR